MNIKVPWKRRLRSGAQGASKDGGWWTRRNAHDDPGTQPKPGPPGEEDLDHLGTRHAQNH